MIMSTLVVVLLVAFIVFALWNAWKLLNKPDANDDGKVDANDVLFTAKEVVAEVKEETVKVAEKVTEKVTEKVKKPRAKKAK
jgi:hypothetical protein